VFKKNVEKKGGSEGVCVNIPLAVPLVFVLEIAQIWLNKNQKAALFFFFFFFFFFVGAGNRPKI
jgi:hypothetical protein